MYYSTFDSILWSYLFEASFEIESKQSTEAGHTILRFSFILSIIFYSSFNNCRFSYSYIIWLSSLSKMIESDGITVVSKTFSIKSV